MKRVVVLTACVTMVAAPMPRASGSTRRDDARPAPARPVTEHFLRDAVPTAGFSSEPEDTTDDFFLPEEQDTKKLVWDIAAWVVGAALVAFFIIKVFIEEDTEEPEDDGSDKPDPF